LVGQWDFATFQESGWGLWVLVAEDEAWVAGLASAQVSALARAEYAEPVFAAVVVVPDAVSVGRRSTGCTTILCYTLVGFTHTTGAAGFFSPKPCIGVSGFGRRVFNQHKFNIPGLHGHPLE
jgi:hypothetical protein